MKILIVDDNQDNRVLLRGMLESRNFMVEEAANGIAALDIARKMPFDLIISDILMPEMDGFTFCRAVKGIGSLRNIPFVFYTATYVDEKDIELGMAIGASRYIKKPAGPVEFMKIIDEVLAEYKEGALLTPEPIQPADIKINTLHQERVAQKLDKKVRDIDNIRHEQALILSSVGEGILVLNREKIFTLVNQAAARMLGYQEGDLAGSNSSILWQRSGQEGEEGPGADSPVYKSIEDGEAFEQVEDVFSRKDGEIFDVEYSASPLMKGDVIQGTVVVFRDITERKGIDKALRKSESQWDRTFNSFTDVVTLQDTDFRIIKVNQSACSILNLNCDEIVGQHCYELFAGSKEPCADCPLIDTKESFESYSREIFHEKLGKTFLVSASAVLDENGQTEFIAHVAKDVSETKQLEKQLRQSQKMEAIGTLAGGIAHDFNNILTAIYGYTDLLSFQLENENDRAHAEEVKRAAMRAKDLVQQILTFSRQTEHDLDILYLPAVIKEVLKLLRSSIPTTIEIRQDIDDEVSPIMADATQMHQVVMNLCTNGYQAMGDEGGILSISLKEKELDRFLARGMGGIEAGGYLVLEISDTGIGIAPENLEKIFDPYFTTKEKGKGTGLGLSVVHGIVKNHGGYISLYSEVGKGTTIKVYLPTLEVGEQKEEADEAVEEVAGGSEHILLVDDDLALLKYAEALLKRAGYQVSCFEDSAEALSAFKENPDAFDLLCTDMTMPKLTGLDLFNEIRNIRPELPAIICTGYSALIDAKKAADAGVDAFITKPFSVLELRRMVRHVLDS